VKQANKQINSLKNLFLKKDFYKVRGVPIESLPLFLDFFPKKSVFLLSQNKLEELVFSLEHRAKKDVVFLSPPVSLSVNFCSNYFDSAFKLSSHFLMTHYKQVDYFFINKDKKKSFEVSPPSEETPFVFSLGCDRDFLIKTLLRFNYSESFSSPSSGEFFCRGGIIEICPLGNKEKYRVSFLEELPRSFLLGPEGEIKKEVPSFSFLPIKNNKKINVFSFLNKDNLFEFSGNSLFNRSLSSGYTIRTGLKTLSYGDFLKKEKSPVVKIRGLQEKAFVVCEKIFVPPWFLSGFKNSSKKTKPLNMREFIVGDLYVHEDFGLCRFLGLWGEEKKEKIFLEFSDGRVSLDVSRLSKLYYFSSQKDSVSLGSLSKRGNWNGRVLKAKKQALECVDFLKKTYVKKQAILQRPCLYHKKDVLPFLKSFKFTDTEDQKTCWKEIVKDLCSSSPMNRLVCGDVGFGKTEIAMRASYLAILNNKRVVVLAPTTILAKQLFECFNERLGSFGCSVGLVSRLQKNQKKTISSFIKNKTDVLVSTHSIFKNLDVLRNCDLFIVDEEHRFGVKQKELIFNINPQTNYLALSATPIPRSLQFCVSKIRNFSLIKTPPVLRKEVVSSVHYFNLDFVFYCITKEINRGGQVFFVDNSVGNLRRLFTMFSSRFKEIPSEIISGKFSPKQISSTMENFVQKKTRVLFSTVIIESGIDIPSANSIIINNAHLLGLAQLHQLRGRVGRSQIRAFAYFLIPPSLKITKEGEARLSAILKNQKLGSGYFLSLRDLEIRGGGFLFGFKQSGFSSVGFEFYSKLLSCYLNPTSEQEASCFVDCFNGFFPFNYVGGHQARADYYKAVFSCSNLKDLKKTRASLLASFGFLPPSVLSLFYNQSLSIVGRKKGIVNIGVVNSFLIISFKESFFSSSLPSFLSFIDSFFTLFCVKYSFKNRDSVLNLSCCFKQTNYLFIRRLIKRLPI